MSVDFHFLSVGDGDCTIIDFPNRVVTATKKEMAQRMMVVDVNHRDDHDEYENVIEYYRRHFTKSGKPRPIFRYVSTHPHKDHLRGLSALAAEIPILNFWDIKHDFAPDEGGPDWDEYKDDWTYYEEIRASESDPKVLRYTDADEPRPFWDEDRIRVLAPSETLYRYVHMKEDGTNCTTEEIGSRLNNLSYVLLINVNKLKIILAGDAEDVCWEYVLKHHSDRIKDIDVLKAPHHGRESGFHEQAVRLMNPKHIVISASEECEHAVPEKYEKAAPNAMLHHTGELGSVILRCGFDGDIVVDYP